VFDCTKCYYVVFCKGDSIAVYLWYGADQSMLNLSEATKFIMDTRFRWMKSRSQAKKMSVMGGDQLEKARLSNVAETMEKRTSILGMEADFADKDSLICHGMVFKPID